MNVFSHAVKGFVLATMCTMFGISWFVINLLQCTRSLATWQPSWKHRHTSRDYFHFPQNVGIWMVIMTTLPIIFEDIYCEASIAKHCKFFGQINLAYSYSQLFGILNWKGAHVQQNSIWMGIHLSGHSCFKRSICPIILLVFMFSSTRF